MSVTFNAFEILEMAEQIERNGVKFYRRAAKDISDKSVCQVLLDLAEMEVRHEETFAHMKKQLSDEARELRAFDPENEIVLYLQAMAGGHVFNLNEDMSQQLKGNESTEEILKLAINAEKDSIVFYLGLRDFAPVKVGKDKVEAIIKEEMSHITLLNQRLSAVKI